MISTELTLPKLAAQLEARGIANQIHAFGRREGPAPHPLAALKIFEQYDGWQARVAHAKHMSKCEHVPLRLIDYANFTAARSVGMKFPIARELAQFQSEQIIRHPSEFSARVSAFPLGDEVRFTSPLGGIYLSDSDWKWRLFPDGLQRYPWHTPHFNKPDFYK